MSREPPRRPGVLVTGGGSGIGAAAARRLSAEGRRVAVLDARDGAAEEVAAGLDGAIALTADVADEAAVAQAVTSAAGAFDGLDALVAAAGIAQSSDTHETTLEEWELVLRVNLTGTFLTVKHVLAHFLARGGGAIVTVGSVASLVAAGPSPSYDASKGGVLQLTRAVAAEYADRRSGRRRRVSVVGISGSGKTTLGRQLAAVRDVPHVELDAIFHQPGWTGLPDDELRRRVSRELDADGRVADGNYAARAARLGGGRHRRLARSAPPLGDASRDRRTVRPARVWRPCG